MKGSIREILKARGSDPDDSSAGVASGADSCTASLVMGIFHFKARLQGDFGPTGSRNH